MKCEHCKSAEATLHHVLVKDNKVLHHHLCEACAKKLKQAQGFDKANPIGAALAGLQDDDELASTANCSNCEAELTDFLSSGRFGCADCYSSFAEDIEPLIKRIHGSDRHAGKGSSLTTSSALPENQQLQLLEKQLEKAVALEDYEEAALLRDEIFKLKEQDSDDNTN